MRTWQPKKDELSRQWWIIDADGQTLGRLATQIANLLRGKTKPTFVPHMDNGDFVVVINSKKIKLTGNKWLQKKYYTHSRYFGSLKEFSAQEIREKNSPELITEAVEGMLPGNILSKTLIKKIESV